MRSVPKALVWLVALVASYSEVSESHLDMDTGYPLQSFRGIPPFRPAKFWDNILNCGMDAPSTLSNHYLLISLNIRYCID
jgi:hypothetical protein